MAQDRARRSEGRSFIQTSRLKSPPTVSAGAFPFFFIGFDFTILELSIGGGRGPRQRAPSRRRTTPIVLNSIMASSHRSQFLTYQASSETR